MKKLFLILLISGSYCFAMNWNNEPQPEIAMILKLAPKAILEQRLKDNGFGDLIKSKMLDRIEKGSLNGSQTALLVNTCVACQVSDLPEYKKCKRSIVNCLLQEFPALTKQLWQKEDELIKLIGKEFF